MTDKQTESKTETDTHRRDTERKRDSERDRQTEKKTGRERVQFLMNVHIKDAIGVWVRWYTKKVIVKNCKFLDRYSFFLRDNLPPASFSYANCVSCIPVSAHINICTFIILYILCTLYKHPSHLHTFYILRVVFTYRQYPLQDYKQYAYLCHYNNMK